MGHQGPGGPSLDLIPPFLLENIIPGEAVFAPLSFIFWRGIIWTPEMWGKGVAEVVPFLE